MMTARAGRVKVAVAGGWASEIVGLVGALIVALVVGVGSAGADVVPVGKAAPEIAQGAWVNSEPLSMQALRGRVVLLDFWTHG